MTTTVVLSTIASTQASNPTQSPTNPPFDPTSYPCGTFMKYDVVNQLNFPQLYGFSAGLAYDLTSIEYVGYGNSSCGGLMPGYVTTSAQPGATISCATGKQFDNTNAYFLLNNPNLQWVSTDSNNIFSVNNILGISGQTSYVFGRYFYPYNNQYQIGRIYIGTGSGIYFVNEANQQGFSSTGFQILTCAPPSSITTTQVSASTQATSTISQVVVTTDVSTQSPTNTSTQASTNSPSGAPTNPATQASTSTPTQGTL